MVKVIYSDRLVRITGKYIFFKRYYFPFGSKCIELSKIDYVEVLNSSMLNGQWRIHGSGDFRTWFPHDANRPKRDRIFVLHLHKGWRRIGFTVENSDALIDIFNNRNVPVRDKQPNNAISEVGAKTKV
jgi:hypothetical protein